MDIVFAPAITPEATHSLESLVEDHHVMFLEVYLRLLVMFFFNCGRARNLLKASLK